MDQPPVIDAPPAMEPPPVIPPKPKGPLQAAWTAFATFAAAVWKFALPLIKLAKGAKILVTAGTMLLSVWFYSLRFGWSFAAGFVVCILIHEMGHVYAAWRLGEKVSAPLFIPGLGALVFGKRFGKSAWEGAIIGYGGPLFGALAAVGCWGLYGLTGNPLFLGLAFTGFLINLFNMTPIYPLDGGRITAAVSPWIWLVGLLMMLGLTVFGHMHNPFVWILIILAIPNLWTGLRRGTMDTEERTTPRQRVVAGLAYVGLCAFLVWGMAMTVRHPRAVGGALHRPTTVQ